jgi:hypothetical protein
MLSEVAVKAKNLKSFRVFIISEPQVELATRTSFFTPNGFSVGCTFTVDVIYREEYCDVFSAALIDRSAVMVKRLRF